MLGAQNACKKKHVKKLKTVTFRIQSSKRDFYVPFASNEE
jgi:hypothetical protein